MRQTIIIEKPFRVDAQKTGDTPLYAVAIDDFGLVLAPGDPTTRRVSIQTWVRFVPYQEFVAPETITKALADQGIYADWRPIR